MEFCPVLYILRLIWIKFYKGNTLNNLLSDCEVRENRRIERCFFTWRVNEFLSLLSTFIVRFGGNSL
jgi:hypothetical protein